MGSVVVPCVIVAREEYPYVARYYPRDKVLFRKEDERGRPENVVLCLTNANHFGRIKRHSHGLIDRNVSLLNYRAIKYTQTNVVTRGTYTDAATGRQFETITFPTAPH
jgi:hypothetical protein